MGELNRTRRTAVVLALVAVLVVPTAVGLAVGQEATATEASNATATPTAAPTPTETTTAPPANTTTATPTTTTATPTPVPPPENAGPYTLEELRRGGTQVENAPDSTRMLPNGEFMYLRKWPAGLGEDGWEYMASGDVYHADKLTFLVVHNGIADPIDATLVVTYWQPKTRQVETEQGIVTQEYAGNQTVQRKDITIEPGYDLNNMTMRSHYDANYRVTAWLELDGEPVDGVRWRFNHQTNRASSQVPFGDSWSSYLGWFVPRFLVLGGVAVGGGIGGAYRYVSRAYVSSEKGTAFWTVMSVVALGAAAIGWWQQVIALVVGLPVLLNVPLFGLAFVMSASRFQSSKTVRVEEPHITNVTDPMGDDKPTVAEERGATYRYVEGDDGIAIVKEGSRSSSIAASLARYFTGPALIPTSEWQTAFDYDGPEDSKLYVDNSPGSNAKCPGCPNLLTIPEEPESAVGCGRCGWEGSGSDLRSDLIQFDPAHWTFEPPGFVYEGEGEDRTLSIKGLGIAAAAVLAVAGVGFGIASQIFVAQWAVYATAAGFGGLAVVAVMARPQPPAAWFNAAPAHANHAKAARLVEIEERKTWDTFEELSEHIAGIEVEGLEDALKLVEASRSTFEERIASIFEVDRSNGSVDATERTEATTDD